MSEFPESLKRRLSRPAAIFGEGVSGRSVAESLAFGGFASVIYDEKGINSVFGPEQAARHDLLIYSPGFAQRTISRDLDGANRQSEVNEITRNAALARAIAADRSPPKSAAGSK